MKDYILAATIVCVLAVGVRAQPSFKEAVIGEAGLNFAEIFLTNIFSKRSVPTALKNAALGATAASLLHQTAWKIIQDPQYALPAQMLFLKGDAIKMKMLRNKPLEPEEFLMQWSMRYLFVEIDPIQQKVTFKPALLASPLALGVQGLFSDNVPTFNIGQSLKTGTFFYGDYRFWHHRQVIFGGQVIYGHY